MCVSCADLWWSLFVFLCPPASVLSCPVHTTPQHNQVIELEGVFHLLRCDVERLFLQAPCVDLDALGQQAAEAEGLVEEQGSIVQVKGGGKERHGRGWQQWGRL